MEPISILCLEDSPLDMELSLSLLTRAGIRYRAMRVETEEQFTEALRERCDDLILADYVLPSFDGMSALKLAREHCPATPFVFVSGAIGEEVAITSLQCGATDYVLKQRLERLAPAVRRALAEAEEKKARLKAEAEREDLLRREREARLEAEVRARELAQINAELEQFAYAASHDLQEPLRMVKAYAQMLVRRYEATLDDDGKEFIGYIEHGVDRMAQLIEDLLAYSRAVHDGVRSLAPIELANVVKRTLEDLESSLQKSGATVTVTSLPHVLGDAERLGCVFLNLLSNSIKYRGSSPPRIEISAQEKNGEWLVCVRDNGIGFEQQYAERVFGLFKRLHGSQFPGTGIGLAIVRRVIEQHGGRIWAESAPGQGAAFFFTLQAAETSVRHD